MPKTTKIIPSDKLKCLSVHKMQSLSCWRRYYLMFIRNLQSRRINLNFWLGGVLHVGWQYRLLGFEPDEIEAAMRRESLSRQRGYEILPEDQIEMQWQFDLVRAWLLAGWRTRHVHWRPDRLALEESEVKITWPVPGHPEVLFCSSLDGVGTYMGKPIILEIKTARTVNLEYFITKELDAQPVSYCLGHKQALGPVSQVLYMVFRKPGIRLRKTETSREFFDRICDDMTEVTHDKKGAIKKNGPEWYFQSNLVPIGKNKIAAQSKSIQATTEILLDRYAKLTKRGTLHDIHEWPIEDTAQCDAFNQPCCFKELCRRGGNIDTFLPNYTQRECLYAEEKKELAT